MITHALNWLVAQGLIRDVVAFFTGFALAYLTGLTRRTIRAHLQHQRQIIDLLDTSTAGGLGDLLGVLGHDQSPRQRGRDGGR